MVIAFQYGRIKSNNWIINKRDGLSCLFPNHGNFPLIHSGTIWCVLRLLLASLEFCQPAICGHSVVSKHIIAWHPGCRKSVFPLGICAVTLLRALAKGYGAFQAYCSHSHPYCFCLRNRGWDSQDRTGKGPGDNETKITLECITELVPPVFLWASNSLQTLEET